MATPSIRTVARLHRSNGLRAWVHSFLYKVGVEATPSGIYSGATLIDKRDLQLD